MHGDPDHGVGPDQGRTGQPGAEQERQQQDARAGRAARQHAEADADDRKLHAAELKRLSPEEAAQRHRADQEAADDDRHGARRQPMEDQRPEHHARQHAERDPHRVAQLDLRAIDPGPREIPEHHRHGHHRNHALHPDDRDQERRDQESAPEAAAGRDDGCEEGDHHEEADIERVCRERFHAAASVNVRWSRSRSRRRNGPDLQPGGLRRPWRPSTIA